MTLVNTRDRPIPYLAESVIVFAQKLSEVFQLPHHKSGVVSLRNLFSYFDFLPRRPQVLDARQGLSATAACIIRNARMQAATTAILTFTMLSTTSRRTIGYKSKPAIGWNEIAPQDNRELENVYEEIQKKMGKRNIEKGQVQIILGKKRKVSKVDFVCQVIGIQNMWNHIVVKKMQDEGSTAACQSRTLPRLGGLPFKESGLQVETSFGCLMKATNKIHNCGSDCFFFFFKIQNLSRRQLYLLFPRRFQVWGGLMVSRRCQDSTGDEIGRCLSEDVGKNMNYDNCMQ